eukprot:scaffold41362_cov25-Prasinocladus_malaysianus.AAC.1
MGWEERRGEETRRVELECNEMKSWGPALMLEKAAAKVAMKRKEIKSAEEVVDSALEAHERAQKELKKSRMVGRVCQVI